MFKSWKGGKEGGGEGVLPYQAAAAKPISPDTEFLFPGFSSEIWQPEHTHLISESQDEQDQTLGSGSKAGPGLGRLQAGSCEQRGDGSLALPAAPRVAALGLGHPVLVLPLICSTLSFLI